MADNPLEALPEAVRAPRSEPLDVDLGLDLQSKAPVATLPLPVAQALMYAAWPGQTFGRLVLGLRVIDATGRPATFVRGFLVREPLRVTGAGFWWG